MAGSPLTLTQLQSQLTALQTAMGNGVLTVRHGDTSVQYRSIAEIRTAIGEVQQYIDAAGGNSMLRNFKLTSSKDL